MTLGITIPKDWIRDHLFLHWGSSLWMVANMENAIYIVLGLLFAFMILLYVVIAVLFPEWVGIQGSLAKKIELEQSADGENSPKTPSEKSNSSN